MPELPEVETVVRELRPWCVGKKLKLEQLFRPSLVKSPLALFQAFLAEPAEIVGLNRLGKWIVFELKPAEDKRNLFPLDQGQQEDQSIDQQENLKPAQQKSSKQSSPKTANNKTAKNKTTWPVKTPLTQASLAESRFFLFVHLRMTGRLILQAANKKQRDTSRDFFYPLRPSDQPRVSFQLSDGSQLLYYDPRALGTLSLGTDQTKAALERSLGLDPLTPDFTVARLAELLKRQKTSIKSFLLNPQKIAGIGNIYAAEILFQAKIHPLSITEKIPQACLKSLHALIQEVLRLAILNKGTSFKDYLRTDNQKGGFQEHLLVYGKENRPCPVCQRPIVRQKQNQRSSFFCAHCQKLYR